MAMKPEASIAAGLGTAALVYAFYDMSLPPLADVRTLESDNRDIQASERTATWVSGAFVAGIGALTKDATVFVIGALAVVGLAWMYRHADQVTPLTGKTVGKLSVPGMTQEQKPADFGYTDQMEVQEMA
jgi:hypothetical protein